MLIYALINNMHMQMQTNRVLKHLIITRNKFSGQAGKAFGAMLGWLPWHKQQ